MYTYETLSSMMLLIISKSEIYATLSGAEKIPLACSSWISWLLMFKTHFIFIATSYLMATTSAHF